MFSREDLYYLGRATLKIYRDSVVEAVRGCLLNWRMTLVHLLYLVLCSVVMRFAVLFGQVAAGFIVGLFLAVVLANYFFSIAAAVNKEKLEFRELWSRGFELFSPTLGVLFTLFILTYVSSLALSSPEMLWVKAVLNLFIAVLFNSLPEVIYTKPGGIIEMFGESF